MSSLAFPWFENKKKYKDGEREGGEEGGHERETEKIRRKETRETEGGKRGERTSSLVL